MGQSFIVSRFGRSGNSGINLCAEPMRAVDRQRYDCRIAGFGFRNDRNERRGIDWKIKVFRDQTISGISLVALEVDRKKDMIMAVIRSIVS